MAEGIIMIIFILLLFVIVSSIEKDLLEENKDLKESIRRTKKENELLYKIFAQIYHELSFLKLKDCPEEEFKNIPLEICNWLEELANIKKETSCQDQEKDL